MKCLSISNNYVVYPNSYMESSGIATINQMMQLIQCNKKIRKPLKKLTKQQHIRVTNNRNLIMRTFNLSSLTVMVKIHTVSSKLWQELCQSMNETLAFISERKQEKFTMRKQLPFHKDKDF